MTQLQLAHPLRSSYLLAIRLACAFTCARCSAVETAVTETLITPASIQAVESGLSFLRDRQLEDGSFGTSGYARNVAVCSLGGMAFLASGSTPTRGTYAEQIDLCIEYLLSQTSDNGFITAPDATSRGPMYGHGFATLFLCEVYGMANARSSAIGWGKQ